MSEHGAFNVAIMGNMMIWSTLGVWLPYFQTNPNIHKTKIPNKPIVMKAHRQLMPMVIWFSMAMEFDIWMMCSFPNSMMRPPSNVQLLDEFLMACMFFLFSNEKGRKRIVLSIRVQVLGFDKSLIQMIQPIHTYLYITSQVISRDQHGLFRFYPSRKSSM